MKFVLLIGAVSFFADFTYEGSRSIVGPFLGVLGASGAVVALVAGAGEFLGYGLRLVSGPLSERTQKFWPITLFGYVIQLLSVPLLALAPSWPLAALLILIERAGKATRNPPRDVMLAQAVREVGYGWGFGLHEAMDQAGALVGPLVVAAVLARRGDYRPAFALLLAPALVALSLLAAARWLYPKPETLAPPPSDGGGRALPRVFWIYLAGAALVAAGFADFPLIAFHAQRSHALGPGWIPVAYSLAMAAGGAGALVFGRLFDRLGLGVLVPLTLLGALFAPLVFLGGFWTVLAGSAVWGLGMGVHESIVPAAVAAMVPAQRRPSAYGLFTAGFGAAWFAGSAVMGLLYNRSVGAVVVFCVLTELAAIPLLLKVRSAMRAGAQA